MSAKMKRRRRHDRLKRIVTHRREDMLFFTRGTYPASAVTMAGCSCGARAFSRDAHGLDDWHTYCEDTE